MPMDNYYSASAPRLPFFGAPERSRKKGLFSAQSRFFPTRKTFLVNSKPSSRYHWFQNSEDTNKSWKNVQQWRKKITHSSQQDFHLISLSFPYFSIIQLG